MKILAIDTTGLVASCAIVADTHVIAETSLCAGYTHTETLMPLVKTMFDTTKLSVGDMDAIAVSVGPGSFTGLRIGISTAKGLAAGAGLGMVAVSSLDGLAYNMINANGLVVPIMDARRNQVYTAVYSTWKYQLESFTEHMAVGIDELIEIVESLDGADGGATFLGDGVKVHEDLLSEHGFSIAPPHQMLQRAASIGALGIEAVKRGQVVAPELIKPTYLRLSQAERMQQQND